jgi:hypothetical protein
MEGSSMVKSLSTSWWNVVLRPWTPTFRGEIGSKSIAKTFAGVGIAALLGTLLSWSLHQIPGQSHDPFMGLASMWLKSGTAAPFASWEILVPCGVIVGFYDFEIALFIVARLFGGEGSFGTQAYAQSLFYAPLAICQQVFVAMPVVTRALFAVAALWSLIPTTASLKAAHGYYMTRAVLTWAAPIAANVVVVAAVIILAGGPR